MQKQIKGKVIKEETLWFVTVFYFKINIKNNILKIPIFLFSLKNPTK